MAQSDHCGKEKGRRRTGDDDMIQLTANRTSTSSTLWMFQRRTIRDVSGGDQSEGLAEGEGCVALLSVPEEEGGGTERRIGEGEGEGDMGEGVEGGEGEKG